ncbi:methionyl-tRNA formyltransferase [Sphingomicrobium astaxanthinifaciens]|uniref:methionyl-tRNA formyltransferase n=1 Tax=Sphingomicrobium astaxanthinifaciens TaxID=1227949 RepID=UPI001FCAE171|nr:methionyl-tRNA formyltransferase [Sphingomicrobium astaxanthinifaciens]MCJ7422187.1 methionyl-tRNA formyltransferase [Sphingomicrobium astaxanthinifaciens]
MRVIMMGSPDFAVPSLDAIVAAGHEVVAAYSQPPRPAGRGKKDQPTAIHRRAEQLGIPVFIPRSLRKPEAQAQFAAHEADVAIVAAYGLILPQPVLDMPRLGCVNVHASLLPRWRGAAPVQRAIMAGDETTGVTLMQMEAGLDTGPMLMKRETPIADKDAAALTEELAHMGAAMVADWLADPAAYPAAPQPAEGVTYAAKIDKAEARTDWSRPAVEVQRHIQGLSPFPGAWTEHGGTRIKLLAAAPADGSGAPGTVLDDALTIACGDGAVRIMRAQRAGKGAQDADVLLRGYAISKGDMLS